VRAQVDLPGDLVDRVAVHAERLGVTATLLWFSWLSQALWLVHQGRGHLLPRVPVQGSLRRLPAGSLGVKRGVGWVMSSAEYGRLSLVLDGAGTTVPAVLVAAGEAFCAVGGDLARMEWPPVA
jgi:hypothetical protein